MPNPSKVGEEEWRLASSRLCRHCMCQRCPGPAYAKLANKLIVSSITKTGKMKKDVRQTSYSATYGRCQVGKRTEPCVQYPPHEPLGRFTSRTVPRHIRKTMNPTNTEKGLEVSLVVIKQTLWQKKTNQQLSVTVCCGLTKSLNI